MLRPQKILGMTPSSILFRGGLWPSNPVGCLSSPSLRRDSLQQDTLGPGQGYEQSRTNRWLKQKVRSSDIPYYTILYYTILYYTILYYILYTIYYTIVYSTLLYSTLYSMLYYILYYTIYYAMLCYAMLCYTFLYFSILYYTILY